MAEWRVPLIWQMYGSVVVTANTPEEAAEVALGPDTPLPGPGESEIVEGSWKVDDDEEMHIEKVAD